ncbi:MAG: hypothetical protein P4L69_10585 [Desulfosporosinus sp.]|nr:hypothetical protein [Desulfosporosinus sp.]
MEIKILEDSIQLKNEVSSIEIMNIINEQLKVRDLILDRMSIDGRQVQGDFEEYLHDRVGEISIIEVHTIPWKKWMDGALIMALQYLGRAIPGVRRLSDDFYRGNTEENWQTLGQLLEGLQWLAELIHNLEQKGTQYYSSWDTAISLTFSFRGLLANLEEAMTTSNLVSVADVLAYQVKPLLEAIDKNIQKTVDSEVKRYDLN